MARTSDWMPGTRQEQLDMARGWISVFNETVPDTQGGARQKYVAWGIPPETIGELGERFGAAQKALGEARKAETRTPVTTAACKTAFDALMECMRQVKRRYLQIPPLSNADYISLGLKPADKKPTNLGAPTARVIPEITGRAQAALTLRFAYVEGSADDSANKARRLYYKVAAHGDAPPATPEDLPKSVPMNRKIETLRLDYADSGKMVYMAAQIENGDFKGPWGALVSAVIP